MLGVTELTLAYCRASDTPSDMHRHVSRLRALSAGCDHVTEMGVREGVSTIGLLCGRPKHYLGYDLHDAPPQLEHLAGIAGVDYEHRVADVLEIGPTSPTDMLLLDTIHTYEQVGGELRRHGEAAGKFIAIHDTSIYGFSDQGGGGKGIMPALYEFLAAAPHWFVSAAYDDCNGLIVLERRNL